MSVALLFAIFGAPADLVCPTGMVGIALTGAGVYSLERGAQERRMNRTAVWAFLAGTFFTLAVALALGVVTLVSEGWSWNGGILVAAVAVMGGVCAIFGHRILTSHR